MLQKAATLTITLAFILPSGFAFAGDDIRVLKRTPISKNTRVPHKVTTECGDLGYDLPATLAQEFRGVSLVKEPKALKSDKGKYFELEMIRIVAKSGGIFSGKKTIVVRGVLYDGGKQIGDVRAQRSSAAAAFGACESLAKVEKTLAKDLAQWLHDPRPNTRL